MKKVLFAASALLGAMMLFGLFADSADAGRGGKGFRGGGARIGGGHFARRGHFRGFRSFRAHRFSGHRSFRSHRSFGRSWAGKQYGRHRHKSYRHAGKRGAGQHGWKKRDHGHKWQRDHTRHHKARHYGHKGKDHAWKGRGHGHDRKKYFIDRGGRSQASANVSVYAAGGGGSAVDVSSIVYAIAAFASSHPGDTGTYEYRDRHTGYSVRFDHKDCDCGDDIEKIYAWMRQSCEKQGKVWDREADTLDEACQFPSTPSLK